MRKLVSLIMAMVMLLSFSSVVFAEAVILNSYSEYDDVELLKEVISNMNEYEKSLFFEMIQSSVEEQQFYRDNIDNSYRVNYRVNIKSDNIDINGINGVYRVASSNKDASIRNAINTFNAGIVTLGLSKTAVMLFKATAASLGAAIADGPIPAGDALFIIMGTLTVSYLAANWEEIGPKWNSIDRLLKTSFSMASYAIGQAMRDLKAKVLDKVSKEKDNSTEKSNEKIEQVLKNKKKVNDTKGDTEIYEGSGGYKQAENDFNKLNKGKVSVKSNGTKVGQLPDGRTINVRKDSSDGRATLEIKKTNSKTIKIRYN